MNATTTPRPFTITVTNRPSGMVLAEYRAASWETCRRKLLALRSRAIFAPGGWVATARRA